MPMKVWRGPLAVRTRGGGDALDNQYDLGRDFLKVIAIITMTIDHVGAFLYPEYEVLRIVGRIAFPIFGYLLVLGAESTRSIRTYLLRLLMFAALSQLPYSLANGYELFEVFNIYFTLAFGLIFLVNSLSLIPVLLLSLFVQFDYGVYGIMLIACLRLLRERTALGVVAYVAYSFMLLTVYTIQHYQLLALPLILLHNTGYLQKARVVVGQTMYPAWRKYLFYLYYPLHLTLLYLIRVGS
jgi:hypothetical protein